MSIFVFFFEITHKRNCCKKTKDTEIVQADLVADPPERKSILAVHHQEIRYDSWPHDITCTLIHSPNHNNR